MKRVACQIAAALLAVPAIGQDQPLTVDLTEIYRAGGANAQEEWAFFGPAPALDASFDEAGNLRGSGCSEQAGRRRRTGWPTRARRRSRGRGTGRVSERNGLRGVAGRPLRGT